MARGLPVPHLSQLLEIPEKTLYDWRQKEKNTTQYAEIQKNAEEEYTDKAISFAETLRSDLEEILKLSTNNLKKKLQRTDENGESPVSVGALIKAIGVTYDKYALLTGNATERVKVSFEDFPE